MVKATAAAALILSMCVLYIFVCKSSICLHKWCEGETHIFLKRQKTEEDFHGFFDGVSFRGKTFFL